MTAGTFIALLERVWPVLLFLALIAVVAELLDVAGGFRAAAAQVSRWGRGRTPYLYAWYCLLAVIVTIVLSIDTTAVLLTPVGIAMARRLSLNPLPFAFASLWLANTASLLLPISNLTNLLAVHGPLLASSELPRLALVPQLVLIVATVGLLAVLFRRELASRYEVSRERVREDPWQLAACVGAIVCIAIAIILDLPAWVAALAALVVLAVVIGVRDRRRLVEARLHTAIPVRALVLAFVLFIVVGVLAALLTQPGGAFAGTTLTAHQLMVAGALSGNVVNNLPAYLFLEPLAGSAHGILGLLIGVNAGAMLTPWGSLATVLWLQICRKRAVDVSWREVLRYGVLLVVVSLGAVAIAL